MTILRTFMIGIMMLFTPTVFSFWDNTQESKELTVTHKFSLRPRLHPNFILVKNNLKKQEDDDDNDVVSSSFDRTKGKYNERHKDGSTFELENDAGTIGLQRAGSPNMINLKWHKIEEITPSNQVVNSVEDFDKVQHLWKTPKNATINNNNCTSIGFSTLVKSKHSPTFFANFTVTTMIFKTTNDVNVTYANTTIVVPKSSIKFTIDISGWKFQSSNNRLRIGAKINSNRYKRNEFKFRNNRTRVVFVTDNGFFDMPSFAVIDGKQITDVNVTTYTTDDQKNAIWLVFPFFNGSLHYDPVISNDPSIYDGTSTLVNNAHSASSNVFVMSIVLLLIVHAFIY